MTSTIHNLPATADTRTGFARVAFTQGGAAVEPLGILYNYEPGHMTVYPPVVTEESVTAVLAYLCEHGDTEPSETHETPCAGTYDRTWLSDCGGYIVTANLGYGYVGAERIVRDHLS
jgi:hypothetical protein